MRNKNLRISKTLIPLDWNPSDPSSYNEWMKMIVQENLKTNGIAIDPIPTGFEIPKPKFISEIICDGLNDSMEGMNNILVQANKILEGGSR
jgi:hypothetical protein